MFGYLLLLFALVPLVELALLFWFARVTSWPVAIAVALLTGVLGVALARRQGLGAWRRIRREMAQGRVPAMELVDGVMILVAGVTLISPGLLTDAVGFLLLIPTVRARLRIGLAIWLKNRAVIRLQMHRFRPRQGPSDGSILDAEFTRKPDESEPSDEDRRLG